MLVKEDGPWNVFSKLRHKAGLEQIVFETPEGKQIGWSAKNTLAEGLTCVWCVSVWTATLLMIGVVVPYVDCAVLWLARILAVSAGAIIVQEGIAFVRGSE